MDDEQLLEFIKWLRRSQHVYDDYSGCESAEWHSQSGKATFISEIYSYLKQENIISKDIDLSPKWIV